MDNKVYVIKCESYDDMDKKLPELIEMMGGISKFVSDAEQIALKVNMLRPAEPDEAVSTHPSLVASIAELAKSAGGEPFIIDSPGAGYKHNEKTLEKLYDKCGMKAISVENDIPLNWDTGYEETSYPGGRFIKRFEVLSPILQSDVVFNLCKMKTHSFMRFTGAVKNNFGVIHGIHKPGYHAKLQDTGRFAQMMLDLSNFVNPRISIMDAVYAMEGEGPGMGTPRYVGLLLASRTPLALDVIASEILGLPRENNPTLLEAEKIGQMPNSLDQVQLIGADLADLRVSDLKFPASIFEGTGFGNLPFIHRLMEPLFKTGMSVKPKIKEKQCTGCRACFDACPVNSIDMIDDKVARIKDEYCIRCYCCHEMCPSDAIELKRSLLHRIMNRQ